MNLWKAYINRRCRSNLKWRRCSIKRKLISVRMLHIFSSDFWMPMLIQTKRQWRIICYHSLQQQKTSNYMLRNHILNLLIVCLRSGKLELSSFQQEVWRSWDRIVLLKSWIHKIYWLNNLVVLDRLLKYRCKRMHDWWDWLFVTLQKINGWLCSIMIMKKWKWRRKSDLI